MFTIDRLNHRRGMRPKMNFMASPRRNDGQGATMNFIILKLFAEYGSVSGGDLATYNMFGGSFKSVNDAKNYFSAGLRFGF